MNDTINSCGDCRFWQPLNKQQLCEQGTCYLNPNEPKARDRLFYCREHKAIEEESEDGK